MHLLGNTVQQTASRTDGSLALDLMSLQHPSRHRLMKIERTRHRIVRFHISEPNALQCSIRRHIERIGLAEESLELERIKIQLCMQWLGAEHEFIASGPSRFH
jgi:hypothetical protein